jgi:hypothetical protein
MRPFYWIRRHRKRGDVGLVYTPLRRMVYCGQLDRKLSVVVEDGRT